MRSTRWFLLSIFHSFQALYGLYYVRFLRITSSVHPKIKRKRNDKRLPIPYDNKTRNFKNNLRGKKKRKGVIKTRLNWIIFSSNNIKEAIGSQLQCGNQVGL
mmetsp:Transcript_25858/g.50345  ORF Transcript_25858/g.50345 Transcript_25858/m.50345 type:complete len:102 (-) Transcript_25858:202-507(-)